MVREPEGQRVATEADLVRTDSVLNTDLCPSRTVLAEGEAVIQVKGEGLAQSKAEPERGPTKTVTEATRLRLEAERKRRQAETALMYAESQAYAASLHAKRPPISPAAATEAPKRAVSTPATSAKPGAAGSRQDPPRAAESVASVSPQVLKPAATVAPSSQRLFAAEHSHRVEPTSLKRVRSKARKWPQAA